MAEKMKIQCPGCGVTLEVTNSTGAATKVVACPKCGKQMMLRFKSAESDTEGTVTGDDPGTVTGGKAQTGPFTGCLVCGGRRYPLSEGRQVVGRKGTQRVADVMLDVTDMTMSRLHALVEVRRTSAGWKVTLTNYKGQLPPVVDGATLADGDIAVLRHGSSVRLGNTELRYEQ